MNIRGGKLFVAARLAGSFVIAVAAWSLMAVPSLGQQPSGGVTSQVGFDQKLGAKLPLEARFRDESGRELSLGELFGKRPVTTGAGLLWMPTALRPGSRRAHAGVEAALA